MVARTFRLTLILALALSGGLIAVSDAHSLGGTIERVSLTDNGKEANDGNRQPSISADGRFVAYTSFATNLVTGNTLQVTVFVHDRESGSVAFIDVDSDGNEGNNVSSNPSISADGRFVAFSSFATNFAPPDTNNTADVFVRDRDTDEDGVFDEPGAVYTTLVSQNASGNVGNSQSSVPAISADGQFVAFQSIASDLVPDDTNNQWDVFVRDLETGTTERVSVDSDENEADGVWPFISSDGRFVGFYTGQLVPLGDRGVWIRDRQLGTTTHVSGSQHASKHPSSISADGRYVIFTTQGVWVYDRQLDSTIRVDVDSTGNAANEVSSESAVSANGRYVAFRSFASNIVPGDSFDFDHLYLRDLKTGETIRISSDSGGNEGNDDSFEPDLSADGRVIAFFSPASNLVPNDLNGVDDVFLFDLGPQPVGGIAELPEVAEAALEAESSSGLSAGALAATAAGAVAGGLALGSVAWYVKRRGRYASLL